MLQRIYPYLTGVILLRDTASKPAITITVWDSIHVGIIILITLMLMQI